MNNSPLAPDLCLVGGTLVTMNRTGDIIENATVGIRHGRIIHIGKQNAVIPPAREVLDVSDCLVFPGLVNTHTHAAMSLLRGMVEDRPLKRWLEDCVFGVERKWVSWDFVYLGTWLACIEMIRSGITTFNDMYYFEEAAAKAIHESGLRAVCGSTVIENHLAAEAAPLTEGAWDSFVERISSYPRVRPALAPHAVYSVSEKMLERARDYCEKHSLRLHMHVAETREEVEECSRLTGKSPVSYLENLGLLSGRLTAAHVVCVKPHELELLGARRVGVSHNPESNLKIGTGIAPVIELRAQGVSVGLGTDSAASNNNLDLLGEADIAAKLQAHRLGAGAMKAEEVSKMLTIEGARALGWDAHIGSLEVGKVADIIAFDLRKVRAVPFYDPYAYIVYAATAADVRHTIVDGEILMKDYALTRVDEMKVLNETKEWAKRLWS